MMWNAQPLQQSSSSSNFIHHMYSTLRANYLEISKVMYKFDHFLEVMLADRGGQFEGISFIQDKYPDKIIDFQKADEMFKHEQSEGDCSAAVVCFPLHPKPHHIVEKPWVQRHWNSEATLN
jgi:hypothetical protein